MPRQVVIPTTGAVTLVDSVTGAASTPPVLVGSSPQWADSSDSSYAELETQEHPDASSVDVGHAALPLVPDLDQNTNGVTIYGRIRYQSLNSEMAPPRVQLRTLSQTVMIGEPGPPGSASIATVDIPLAPTGSYTLAAALSLLTNTAMRLYVSGPFLRVYSFRYPRTRIFEASLVVSWPTWEPAHCQNFPRDDRYGVGAAQNYPPPKSQQGGRRNFGYW